VKEDAPAPDTKVSEVMDEIVPGSKAGEVRINPRDGAEMVWVPAGEFLMGSTDEHVAAELEKYEGKEQRDLMKFVFDFQKPQRKVYPDGYWMYKHEVTVAQYRKFCKATGRKMPEAPKWGWKDDHPMVLVTWQDAAKYAKWARVSLPTEAQWEKAARGTDGRIYPWGNKWDASKCANGVRERLNGTMPAGSYPAGASPYGAMDMAGNVWEWCADWFDPNYYKNAPSRNPSGPSKAVEFTTPISGKVTGARVLRGGSWSFNLDCGCQCARRYCNAPDFRSYYYFGFRCARTP
jgi:formylglycine-generating enzyme required for sulfatase activity